MKVKVLAICFAIIMINHAKVTKKMRDQSYTERELLDMGINGSAEQILDQSDSTAIDNAAARMASLVDRVNRLKTKLQRELQTTVSYLRYHFNQRDVFDKRVMMQHLSAISNAPSVSGDRKLLDEVEDKKSVDQPMLKDYGKISVEVKEENFENVKVPEQDSVNKNNENIDNKE